MQRTKIDWGVPNLYTWNPVTGCKRGCPYCYARRIYQRFNKTKFTEIIFHEERLNEPLRTKHSKTIFVGSMSDIAYWPKDVLQTVLNVCKDVWWHKFMFLTKDPLAYYGQEFPGNTMQGLTITHANNREDMCALLMVAKHPYLSIEPLLGHVNCFLPNIERVIVGAMTGRGAVVPKAEWIKSIKQNVPKEKLFWKPSIKELAEKI